MPGVSQRGARSPASQPFGAQHGKRWTPLRLILTELLARPRLRRRECNPSPSESLGTRKRCPESHRTMIAAVGGRPVPPPRAAAPSKLWRLVVRAREQCGVRRLLRAQVENGGPYTLSGLYGFGRMVVRRRSRAQNRWNGGCQHFAKLRCPRIAGVFTRSSFARKHHGASRTRRFRPHLSDQLLGPRTGRRDFRP